MKVLDLRCAQGHGFEGWFASGDAFESQLAAGMVDCPVCGETDIAKLLAAPRLNLSGAKEPREAPIAPSSPAGRSLPSVPTDADSAAAHWMKAVREVMSRTEDVGERFAEEARKMHYGESQERAIRGQATLQQAQSLVEEGIDVMPLPLPPVRKENLQ